MRPTQEAAIVTIPSIASRQPPSREQIERMQRCLMVGDGADQVAALWAAVLAIEAAMASCSDERAKQQVQAAIAQARAQVEAIAQRRRRRLARQGAEGA